MLASVEKKLLTLDLPLVEQSLDFTCGAACFESMYRYLRKDSPGELYFAQKMGTLDLGYTEPKKIAELAVECGFKVEFKKGATYDDLYSAIFHGKIVFVTWWYEDSGHYSLVKNLTVGEVVLMDPWVARDGQYHRLPSVNFKKFWKMRGNVMIAVSEK
jgi:predicted double-glycine peptidase